MSTCLEKLFPDFRRIYTCSNCPTDRYGFLKILRGGDLKKRVAFVELQALRSLLRMLHVMARLAEAHAVLRIIRELRELLQTLDVMDLSCLSDSSVFLAALARVFVAHQYPLPEPLPPLRSVELLCVHVCISKKRRCRRLMPKCLPMDLILSLYYFSIPETVF